MAGVPAEIDTPPATEAVAEKPPVPAPARFQPPGPARRQSAAALTLLRDA
jgi:hypothetical protein